MSKAVNILKSNQYNRCIQIRPVIKQPVSLLPGLPAGIKAMLAHTELLHFNEARVSASGLHRPFVPQVQMRTYAN